MRSDGRLCQRGENIQEVLGALLAGDEATSPGGRTSTYAPLDGPDLGGRGGRGMSRPVSPAPV